MTDIYSKIDTNLRSLCGTAKGRVNMCDHDHSPMAVAIVAEVARHVVPQAVRELITKAETRGDDTHPTVDADLMEAYAEAAEAAE